MNMEAKIAETLVYLSPVLCTLGLVGISLLYIKWSSRGGKHNNVKGNYDTRRNIPRRRT